MTDDRLVDVEIKLAFQEKLLAELDDTIRSLRDEVEALRGEVAQLAEQARSGRDGDPAGPGGLVDEKPPHY
ncbi:MAG: SlyX family protein [Myxococcota bacterium]